MKASKQDQERYQKLVQQKTPSKPILRNVVLAFIVGGIITTIGQLVMNLYISLGMTPKQAAPPTAATMVFLGAFLTGLGVYDRIGKIGGMGSALPITGFANSIVSPAMEFKREGYVLGVGSRMFTVAGPVIVYGMAAAVAIGFIYWLVKMLV